MLRELIERGLLCVIDGAKGLREAMQTVLGSQALVQRCQWYKRENIVAYLPKSRHALWRRTLQAAYEHPTSVLAKAAMLRGRTELRLLNASAVTSLDEGFEETLTLHRLGLFGSLGISLKTTNCIESLNAQLGAYTAEVDRWCNSEQKHRWVGQCAADHRAASAPIKGYRHLPLLRAALQREIASSTQQRERVA